MAILWRHVFGENTRDHAIALLDADGSVDYQERASQDEWRIEACPIMGRPKCVNQ